MPPTLIMKTATGVNRVQRANRRPVNGIPGLVVLTLEDADRKLEAMAHEALTVLGRMMWWGQDDSARLAAATAVLRAWEQHQRWNR